MTKEEAKKIFFELLLFGKAPCKKEELEDLCKLVLTALEQEPTKNDLGVDCVSRKDVFETIDDCNSDGLKGIFCSYDDGERFKEYIKNLPPVTLQEPKTGHWIEMHDDWGNGIITDRRYKCSVCHGKHIDPEMGEWHEVFDYKYPFCPNCGAKMAESEAEDGKID